jgi:glycerol-3-phosphate dehydrogenase
MKLNDTVYKKYIVPSQGILYSTSLLLSDYALMIPQVTDFVAVPWHNKKVVGTTDTNEKHIEPIALETEIES